MSNQHEDAEWDGGEMQPTYQHGEQTSFEFTEENRSQTVQYPTAPGLTTGREYSSYCGDEEEEIETDISNFDWMGII